MKLLRSLSALAVLLGMLTLTALAGATPAFAASSVGSQLGPGAPLNSGDWLTSPNGAYRFVMQGDGNLVLYGPSGPLWATYTNSNGARFVNQGDGNLVVYTSGGSAIWASRSNKPGGATLVLQDDGNLVAYAGNPIWSTYTNEGSKMAATAAVAFERAHLGKPYQYGATGPNSYDCSGLTQKALASAGVGIARTSYDQWNQGRAISQGALQPGDLVFYNGRSHVGMFVGNGEVIQALKTGTNVTYYSLGYAGSIDGFRRMT